jgi:hypothetical protein
MRPEQILMSADEIRAREDVQRFHPMNILVTKKKSVSPSRHAGEETLLIVTAENTLGQSSSTEFLGNKVFTSIILLLQSSNSYPFDQERTQGFF